MPKQIIISRRPIRSLWYFFKGVCHQANCTFRSVSLSLLARFLIANGLRPVIRAAASTLFPPMISSRRRSSSTLVHGLVCGFLSIKNILPASCVVVKSPALFGRVALDQRIYFGAEGNHASALASIDPFEATKVVHRICTLRSSFAQLAQPRSARASSVLHLEPRISVYEPLGVALTNFTDRRHLRIRFS